ncbi:MAG: class I SAM-dependent methyltransferase [Provencibacterium sp.]|jgi:ubiquinone/menaquinone biosynthesis C-methylase UbiE|nr:class I SAM-dependent methyltransferase [Provencibacterium sp.]
MKGKQDAAFDCLNQYYQNYDEEGRLLSPHGQVEYQTTMRYITESLQPGMRILEVGAGTGRYSHALARLGYEVEAIEYIPHNLELLLQNTQPGEKLSAHQGTATDLSRYPENAFDRTLLLGPMYHLFTEEEKQSALKEAVRVTRPGGLLFVSYCQSDASILCFGFQKGLVKKLLEDKLLDPETFTARSTPKELFVLHRKADVERMTAPLAVTRLHYVGTDMATQYMRETVDAMDEETFSLYLRYHFSICERPDLIGASHHALDILKKNIQ